MNSILVGTASWTDVSLVKSGLLYPAEVKSAEQRLRYYANEFALVEVDSTYYAMPSERNAQLWAERTPDHFLFNLKMFRLFTQHQTDPKVLTPNVRAALGPWDKKSLYYADLPEELKDEICREFTVALEPLVKARKLGALLFQFPRWFTRRRASFDHMREIRSRLPDHRIAVEFRHESWFDSSHQRESTVAFEREMQFVNVVVDEPQLPGSIPSVWEVTNEKLAIFRLHGRNARTWIMKGLTAASERFDYDYSEQELQEFIPHVRRLSNLAAVVHVIVNTNFEDQGIRAGRILQRLLGEH